MIALIRLTFFLAVFCFALGLGGAYQGYVKGQLVFYLVVAGVGLTAIAFLFSVIVSILKPATNRKSKEFEMPVTATLSLFLGLVVLAAGGYGYMSYGSKPMIRDISTDTDNPPKFRGKVKTIEALEGLEFLPPSTMPRGYNPMDGMEQMQAYQNVRPAAFKQNREVVYQAALVAAKTSPGWQISFEDSSNAHFEATVETELFHFIDDIAVEVRTDKQQKSILQVRSRSRVGIFDLGTNAARITQFITKVTEKVPQIAKRMEAQQSQVEDGGAAPSPAGGGENSTNPAATETNN